MVTPAYRVKGICGHGRRRKPEVMEFKGMLYRRDHLKEARTEGLRRWRFNKRQVKARVAKQARKYNRNKRPTGKIDIKRLRGRRTRWGA